MTNKELLSFINNCRRNGKKVNENNKKAAQYWFNINEDTLTIDFEGSIHFYDWICNFTFTPTKIPYKGSKENFKVHKGFLKQYKTVRDEILELVKNNKIEHIRIYGHSLGGALATLCHEDMMFHYPNKDIVTVAVAPPMVLKEIPEELGYRFEKLYNVINEKDVITKLPFSFIRKGSTTTLRFRRPIYPAHDIKNYLKYL